MLSFECYVFSYERTSKGDVGAKTTYYFVYLVDLVDSVYLVCLVDLVYMVSRWRGRG